MHPPISDDALDAVFRNARTFRRWQDKPVSPALLMAIYDLMRLGPTSGNCCPARIVFVVSRAAKDRLKPHLDDSNAEKTMSAPATAIVGFDLDFAERLPVLYPQVPDAQDGYKDPVLAERVAFRNGSVQGGYFIIAARALGLDCGPMSGFDNAGVDCEFFADSRIRSNFHCNIGYGDTAGMRPRNPRLPFEEACSIL
ncbi:MAG TPA: malonic semialdehyde reductase [Rhizomicrobium sp.]|jgi:3-hydroxypropanoate dehydrogenase|nr:malonic semialdehyde reductase [Rhizomicrobium sp.]